MEEKIELTNELKKKLIYAWGDGFMNIVTTSGFIKLAIGTVLGFKLGEWTADGTLMNFMDDVKNDEDDDKKEER